MKTHLLNTTFALVLISLGYFATDIYIPSLPSMSQYFHTSELLTQMTLFSYMLSFSFTPLVFGPLSDNIGRKKVILCGLFISLLATVGCSFSPSINWLITFRFIQGIGTGAVMISARAMIPDLYSGKALAKQISIITMFMPLVLAFAPTLGGFLQEAYGWRSIFLFLIFYIFLIFFKMSFFTESLKESSARKLSELIPIYLEIFENRSFMLFGMGMVFPTIGLFAYLTASPYLFQKVVGLSPSEYGMLAIYIGSVIMLTSFLNARLLHYVPINALICVGITLILVAGALMLTFHLAGIVSTWALLLPSLFYFSCLPFNLSNSASKAMSQISKHYGAASALLSSIQFFAGALGSLIFSLIKESSALPLSLCFLLVGIFALFFLFLARKYEMATLA